MIQILTVKYKIVYSWLLYISLTIAISLQGYFDYSICRADFAPMKIINDVYLLEAGGFIVTSFGCAFRITRIKNVLNCQQSAMFALLIIFISTISSVLNLFGIGGLCQNNFGLTLPAVRWIQWLICFPLLEVALITIDEEEVFSLDQLLTVTLQTFSLLCLVVVQTIVGSTIISYVLILIASISYIGSYYLFFRIMRNYEISHIHDHSQNSMDVNFQIPLRKLRHFQILLCILPLFPILYILTITKVLGTNVSILLYIIFNSTIFLFFTSSLINIHIEVAQLQLASSFNANVNKRTFLRYVFHEVRVPLNSITLGIHLLNSSNNMTVEDKESLLLMREASMIMSQTLNDVLSIQRIEEGQVELVLQPFFVKDFISDILLTYRNYILDKNAVIRTHIDDDVPIAVIGDKLKLEHIIGNLLTNALKFSTKNCIINITVKLPVKSKLTEGSHRLISALAAPTQSIREAMRLSSANLINTISNYRLGPVQKETIIFSVGDSGQGISEEALETLFRPYAQVRPGELTMARGSGIGLAICKELVTLHGGEISCESKPGIGSIFTVTIPFEIPPPPPPPIRNGLNSSNHLTHSQRDRMAPCGSTTQPPHEEEVRLEEDGGDCPHSDASFEQEYYADPNARRVSAWIGLTVGDGNGNDNNNNSSSHGIASRNSHHSLYSIDNSNGFGVGRRVGGSDAVDENTAVSMSQHSWYRLSKPHSVSPFNSQLSLFNMENELDNFVATDDMITSPSPPTRYCHSNITTIVEIGKDDDEDDDDGYIIGGKCDNLIPPKNFLVVDDVLSNRKMLSLLLTKKGVDCDLADNGAVAVESVRANPTKYDVIFMDNMMPVMTGVLATKELRDSGFRNLIIGLTGNALDVDVAVFEGAGADMVLSKPLKLDDLEQLLLFVDSHGVVSKTGMKLTLNHDRLRWVSRS